MNHNQLSPGDRSVCTFDKTSMKWAFFVSDVSRFQENFRLGMRISERFQIIYLVERVGSSNFVNIPIGMNLKL